jgi:hypothetical protein
VIRACCQSGSRPWDSVWHVTTPGALPLFIPIELCDTVGRDPKATPVDVCLGDVYGALRDGGVSAPAGSDIGALRSVVTDAGAKGIDLKLVVVPNNPVIDTPLRDVATEVGREFPGSTVLVISPGFAGTYSTQFDRVTLEAGQDYAKIPGNPVLASQNFVNELVKPHFDWTPFTIVLVIGVAVAAVATRVLQVRARRAGREEPVETA